MIKAAIIGLGEIGCVHIEAIKNISSAEITAGSDLIPERKVVLPENATFFSDYHLIPEIKPDVVHICLPHYLHFPVAKFYAESGINIFTEKPLAMNAVEGEEYAKLEIQFGVKICLCFQNRLNTTSEVLFTLLRSGEYGAVKGVRGYVAWHRDKAYYAQGPWRGLIAQAGGGCMINQAIHTIDLMQYFAGSPVVSVKGFCGQMLDLGVEVEDTASGRIVFKNNVEGLFTASITNYTDEEVEIAVYCEKSNFLINNKKLYRIHNGEREILAEDSATFSGKAVYGDSHTALIARFYRALEMNSNDYIHPEEGIPSLKIIDAIRESSKTGKTIQF